ncbi:hypothetical protein LCGC14_0267400 [marine sediment metagenome]|uniref:Uncharacterized protein n=1 Tax=marine sediment metagenome TaxID=412755 RepID=A0A0F9U4N4_9ZZZZ
MMVWIFNWFTKADELKLCQDALDIAQAENKKFRTEFKLDKFEIKYNYKVDLKRKVIKSFTAGKSAQLIYDEIIDFFPSLAEEGESLEAWLPIDAEKQEDSSVQFRVANGWAIVLVNEKAVLIDGCSFHNYVAELFKIA